MGTFKKWGFGPGKTAQIFDVSDENGGRLPTGWHESPGEAAGAKAPPPHPPPPPPLPQKSELVPDPSGLPGAAGVLQSVTMRDILAAAGEPDTLEQLRDRAMALGITVDGRWKEARLKTMIEAIEAPNGDDA